MEPILHQSAKAIAAAFRDAQRNHLELVRLYETHDTPFEPIRQSATRLRLLRAAHKVAVEEERYGLG